MADYTIQEITDKTVWEDFVLSQKPSSFLQSWNWGETHVLLGEKIKRLGFFSGKKLVGVCLLINQKAKRGPHFLIPGGPLIDWNNKSLVSAFVSEIVRLGKKERVWFIRMRPELLDSTENKLKVKSYGFVSAPMHLHAENTWILDTSGAPEKILSGMRKNTRYSVKKSFTSKLQCEISSDTKKINILTTLQEDTVTRHKFVGFSTALFKAQMQTFGKDNEAKLFIVRKGKVPLAAAIIIFYGDYAYYHHSGSSNKFREIPSSYFLQWKVIEEAQKRQLKGYNFWGVAPLNKMNHRFSGVTTFKTGFGGARVDWLHAHDLPLSSLYWTTYAFETGRKLLRGL